MRRKKLLAWCDFLVDTGFGHVAENLLKDMYQKYDTQVLAINHHGEKHYNTEKYFVYPVSRDDMLGMKRLIPIVRREQPDIVFLFQDIFHISDVIDKIRNVLHPKNKIVVYFPVDGQPFSRAWGNVLNVADAVITYSDWAIKVIRDRFPDYKKEIYKLYHGVDPKVYHPIEYKTILKQKEAFGWAGKFVVVNINRFQPRKCIPLSIRAFSMFAKGYKVCKCGNHMPLDRTSCDVNPCSPRDIKKVVKHDRDDVFLYLHMMASEMSMGPGRTNVLQNHLLNASFTDEDVNNIIGVNAANIYAGAVSDKVINDIYNIANVNISSSLGEGALLKGTQILTKNGYKPIEEVTKGDYVINDKGKWSNVNKTLETKFTEPVFSIRLSKFTEPLICSKDHPLLLQDGTYKRADELNLTDIVALRRPKYNLPTPEKLDLSNYVSSYDYEIEDKYLISKKSTDKKKITRYIPINKDICKFFGLYIAEGATCPSGIRFSFHNDETDLHKFVIDTYQKYINIYNNYKKPEFKKSDKDNSGYIILSAPMLGRMFKEMFGTNAHTKKFPLYFLSLDIPNKESLLNGLIAGDGDISNKRHYTRYKTVSQYLAYLVRDVWLTLGKVASVNKEDNSKGFGDGYIYSVKYYEDRKPLKTKGHLMHKYELTDEFVYLNLLSISKIEPYGTGYDLEVPDGESYTTAQATVHNCGLSLLEAAAAGTPSIAPANSAIPEMLRRTGHLIPNVCVMNQALDNGHLRPVVDVWKMTEALEKEYQKWKESPNEKDINADCLANIQKNFKWDDKVEVLNEIFDKVLETNSL